jgi:pyruvate/2-oxoglutarate dehydrogenase complex dihydrolipoamide dehydrogenase (E3) component
MAHEKFDAIVIGAGQAGPTLAVRLAKAGHKTALLERARVGGTCVHTGCTPTKALVATARVAALARRAAEFGVRLEGPVGLDFARVHQRMRGIVEESAQGLEAWLKGTEGLSLIAAHARFTAADTIVAGERTLSAPRIFLNVGCRPAVPDWARDSGQRFFTSSTLLGLQELPEHLAIVGGGAIGLEFAQAFRRFGSRVTVIEKSPQLLPREDPDAAAEVKAALEDEGVHFELGAGCFGLAAGDRQGEVAVDFACDRPVKRISASHVLVAVGRAPNTHDLGLDAAGVKRDERGYVPVDGQLRTNVPGIWALGDVNGRGAFTHTSYNDHEVVAANLLDGESRSIDARVPRYALYTDPPLARIGDSEQQARERGGKVLRGFIAMKNVGRGRERSETRGFMKVLVDAASMRLLGATLVCIDGDEVVHSLVDVMTAGIDVRTIAASVPIHPTVSELIPTMLQRLKPL